MIKRYAPPNDSSWIEPLPDGHQGTIRTLETMRYLCRKDYRSDFVRACVSEILYRAPRLPYVEALFLFARDQVEYIPDPPQIEKVADFRRTTESRGGDCDDKCVWLATALLSINVPARFVCQSYGRTWDHVYVEFYDWGRLGWAALDPTADGHSGVLRAAGWRQPLPASGYEMRFDV